METIYVRKFGDKYSLTEREYEVYKYLCQGYTYDDCALLMTLARCTVSSYVRNIFQKKQVNSLPELLAARIKELEEINRKDEEMADELVTITTQIPKVLNEKIKKYKEETGMSIYRIIVKALEEFFNDKN